MGRDAKPDFGSGSGSVMPFHQGTDPSRLAQEDNLVGLISEHQLIVQDLNNEIYIVTA